MSFTKAQRQELNKLSFQLFGVEGKWRSLLSRPEFRVATETTEDSGQQKYVSLHNSNKSRTGTVMKLETAIAKGMFESKKEEDHKKAQELLKKIEETPVKKVASREPTFEELRDSLIDNIDLQKLGRMTKDEFASVVAYRLVNGGLKMSVLLDVKPADKADFDNILATLSEENQAKIKAVLPDLTAETPPNPNAILVDGLTVLKEAALVITNPEEAQNVYISLLVSKELKSEKNSNLIKGISVEQFINKQNRKKNALVRDKQLRPEYYARKEARAKAKAEEVKKAQEDAAKLRAELDAKAAAQTQEAGKSESV